MADKYIELVNGQMAQREALVESTGAGHAGRIPALGSNGRLDESVMPPGIGADVKVAEASENLAAGDVVNIWDDSGTERARKADASNGRRAHGFVLAAVTSSQNATVYKEGTVSGLSGLAPGGPCYLSADTAGAVTQTPPSTAGHIVQEVGIALSATEMDFEPQRPVTLA